MERERQYVHLGTIWARNIVSFLFKVLRNTAQKMKFSIKAFFSKCDQIRRDFPVLSESLNAIVISYLVTLFFFNDNILVNPSRPVYVWELYWNKN